jgi:hypothetical protein
VLAAIGHGHVAYLAVYEPAVIRTNKVLSAYLRTVR